MKITLVDCGDWEIQALRAAQSYRENYGVQKPTGQRHCVLYELKGFAAGAMIAVWRTKAGGITVQRNKA